MVIIMIGGIDSQADIDLYLEVEELERLPHTTIEGVLVKTFKLKKQGTISLSINDVRKNENGSGIGLDDKQYWGVKDGFRVDVFMGSEWYQELKERGVVGIRQGMRDGSKIKIYDRARLDSWGVMDAENLEFYRDNKEILPKYFE